MICGSTTLGRLAYHWTTAALLRTRQTATSLPQIIIALLLIVELNRVFTKQSILECSISMCRIRLVVVQGLAVMVNGFIASNSLPPPTNWAYCGLAISLCPHVHCLFASQFNTFFSHIDITADMKELLRIFIFSGLHNTCTQHPGHRRQASSLCLHETSYLKNLLTHF